MHSLAYSTAKSCATIKHEHEMLIIIRLKAGYKSVIIVFILHY